MYTHTNIHIKKFVLCWSLNHRTAPKGFKERSKFHFLQAKEIKENENNHANTKNVRIASPLGRKTQAMTQKL